MLRFGVPIVLLALAACSRATDRPRGASGSGGAGGPAAGGTPTPGGAGAPAQRPDGPAVVLAPEGRPEVRVSVEIARTEEERRRGLMWRQHIPENAGMLFLFEDDEIHEFWMKNTLIPLDMIFIQADLTVAGVVENAAPKTTKGRSIDVPSRHVLEVNGGFARAHGIAAGTRVRFEHVPEVTTK